MECMFIASDANRSCSTAFQYRKNKAEGFNALCLSHTLAYSVFPRNLRVLPVDEGHQIRQNRCKRSQIQHPSCQDLDSQPGRVKYLPRQMEMCSQSVVKASS